MFPIFAKDLAIDLGTANTLVYINGQGVVLNEPSIVAVRKVGNRKVAVAFGAEAKAMLGRTPQDVEVVRPVRTGVIADFAAAGMLLEYILSKVRSKLLFKPRVIIGIPSGITEVEKKAIEEAVASSTRDVKLIDEAMAAASFQTVFQVTSPSPKACMHQVSKFGLLKDKQNMSRVARSNLAIL